MNEEQRLQQSMPKHPVLVGIEFALICLAVAFALGLFIGLRW